MTRSTKSLLVAASIACSAPAFAVSLSGIYTDSTISSGVFQNAAGQFSSTAAPGFSDVTALFKLNANAAFSYFQNSIGVSWSHAVTFRLGDLTPFMADGTSLITAEDANKRTTASEITLDTSANSRFYLDPTPANNSEWTMMPKTAMLGGTTVNVGRKGTAVTGGPADGRTDILTLIIHETAHSLGLADGSDLFSALVGPSSPTNTAGDANARTMTLPTALTGYASSYALPFRASAGHISTAAAGGIFAEAVTSEPGFGEGDRALLSDVEIHALCLVNGCTAAQVTLNPSINAIPEPGTWLMMALGAVALLPVARRRAQAVA